MSLQEYIVTLHNREELENFYTDMETEGGNLYIPERQVDVARKRPISRNTHYMLTEEEAELVKQDERVWDVELKAIHDAVTVKPSGYTITDGEYDKSPFADDSDNNWGMLRHTEVANRSNWGNDGNSLVTDNTVKITASGKNVDVLIVDGHGDPSHPEFAVNEDGTGGSRIQEFNWFSLNPQVTGGAAGTYLYAPYTESSVLIDNNHGTHVAGTVAGNDKGWARDANIYFISPYGTNPNDLNGYMWDYIRIWHNTKAVNTETGRRNPTISNHSYGTVLEAGAGGAFGKIKAMNYRGTTFNPGRDLTQAELQARGCYAPNATPSVEFPFYSSATFADIQDAIDDGIIVVTSAGNESWKIVANGDQDHNNIVSLEYLGSTFNFYSHRSGSVGAYNNAITVGAASNLVDERKGTFSNCGSLVDIFAAGQAINSSLLTNGVTDVRNASYRSGKYQGTSMASPQVAGVLALLAEHRPGLTQLQASEWLLETAIDDAMFDSAADDAMDLTSLQGGPNKLLYWKNIRPVDGAVFPRNNVANRTNTKQLYPRPKIRRKG